MLRVGIYCLPNANPREYNILIKSKELKIMRKKQGHLFVTEMDSAKDGLCFRVDEKSLLLDFKALLKDYYAATFNNGEDGLCIVFDNGQKFLLSVKEIS